MKGFTCNTVQPFQNCFAAYMPMPGSQVFCIVWCTKLDKCNKIFSENKQEEREL